MNIQPLVLSLSCLFSLFCFLSLSCLYTWGRLFKVCGMQQAMDEGSTPSALTKRPIHVLVLFTHFAFIFRLCCHFKHEHFCVRKRPQAHTQNALTIHNTTQPQRQKRECLPRPPTRTRTRTRTRTKPHRPCHPRSPNEPGMPQEEAAEVTMSKTPTSAC